MPPIKRAKPHTVELPLSVTLSLLQEDLPFVCLCIVNHIQHGIPFGFGRTREFSGSSGIIQP